MLFVQVFCVPRVGLQICSQKVFFISFWIISAQYTYSTLNVALRLHLDGPMLEVSLQLNTDLVRASTASTVALASVILNAADSAVLSPSAMIIKGNIPI